MSGNGKKGNEVRIEGWRNGRKIVAKKTNKGGRSADAKCEKRILERRKRMEQRPQMSMENFSNTFFPRTESHLGLRENTTHTTVAP